MNSRSTLQIKRKPIALQVMVFVFAIITSLHAKAQDLDRYSPFLPQSRTIIPRLPAPPFHPIDGSPEVLVQEIKGIMILDSESRVRDPIKAFAGLKIDPAAKLTVALEKEFEQAIEPYLGSPISIFMLNEMARNMVLVYRDFNQPVVDINIPPGQDITDGIVQVVITESKIGKVDFRCNSYFSDCNLASQTCLRPGQIIYVPHLHNGLIWYNKNPFRQVGVSLEPGASPGTTDVVFDVHDRRPIHAYVGYEDSGTRASSRERILFGATVGNLWDRDHQLSYQYVFDAEMSGQLGVHSLVYTAPIFENRDEWSLYGMWADIDAQGPISDAEAWQVSGRYKHILCEDRCRLDDFHFGFDVKGTNNDLDFGGNTVVNSEVHIVQFMAGINSKQIYEDGQTQYGLDFFISPGDLLRGNRDGRLGTLRSGARATYMYARGYLERLYSVDCNSDFLVRATGQISDYKLLHTEQLGYGGYQSIRGYDMRAANGDAGYIVNLEYRTKPIVSCCNGHDTSLVALAFTDFGQQFNWNAPGLDTQPNEMFLASVGVGVRYTIDPAVTLRMDYGLPLNIPGGIDPGAASDSGRVHIGAVLAF